MPILRGLKREILAEKEKEKHIIDAINTRLRIENNIDFDIHVDIADAIEWYKNSLPTVWKRPMNPNNKDAWKLIELRTKSIIKKKYKLKDIKISNNSTKEIICCLINGTYYIAEGLTKKEFTEKAYELFDKYTIKRFDISKKSINSAIYALNEATWIDIRKHKSNQLITPITKYKNA